MTHQPFIPLFPLGVVLFPGIPLPLHIFEERYKQMIHECLENDQVFGISLYTDGGIREVGCTARVVEVLHTHEDGRMDILTEGLERFVIDNISQEKPYLQATVNILPETSLSGIGVDEKLTARARKFLGQILKMGNQKLDPDQIKNLQTEEISFLIAAYGGFSIPEKQMLLEIDDTAERLTQELDLMKVAVERLKMSKIITKAIHPNGHSSKLRD